MALAFLWVPLKNKENKMSKKVGRKPKLTPEVQKIVCDCVFDGLTYEKSAQCAGIGKSTFFRWMAMGEDESCESIYREFRDAVKKAEADLVREQLRIIKTAGAKGTWQAAAWHLERRFPEDYSLKKQVVVEDNRSVRDMSDSELEEELRKVESEEDY